MHAFGVVCVAACYVAVREQRLSNTRSQGKWYGWQMSILSDDNFVKTILSDEKSASTGDVSKYPVNVMGNKRIGGWQWLPWGMRRFSWASQGQESFPQSTKATKIAASHSRKTAFADVVGQVDSGGAGELW